MRQVSLFLAVCVAAVASGCGSSSDTGTQLRSRPAPEQLSNALVNAMELSRLPGAPLEGFQRRTVEQASVSNDPDPRGPCGAKVAGLSLRTGALRAFSSQAGITMIQWVNRLPSGRAKTVIDADLADARPGCADYRSQTPSGTKQKVHFVGAVPLPASLADQRSAMLARINGSVDAMRIELRRDDCLLLIISFATQRPSRAFVRALAATAADHLEAVPRSSCRS